MSGGLIEVARWAEFDRPQNEDLKPVCNLVLGDGGLIKSKSTKATACQLSFQAQHGLHADYCVMTIFMRVRSGRSPESQGMR